MTTSLYRDPNAAVEDRVEDLLALMTLLVSLEVQNTGEWAGDEVVQLYGRDLVASVARHDQLLLGFMRLSLVPGERRKVTFTVHPSRLAFYDSQMRFVTEPGDFTLSVGGSSTDIRAQETIALSGETSQYRQRDVVVLRQSSLVGLEKLRARLSKHFSCPRLPYNFALTQ